MNRTKTLQGPPRVYIAGRFRGPKNQDVQRHIDVASWFRAPVAEEGCFPVCVHVGEGLAMHDIQQANAGQFWLDVTLDELRTCDAVVVVPGWQSSSGTYWEVQEALRLGMPVFEATWAGGISVAFDAMPAPSATTEWIQIEALLGDAGDAHVSFNAFVSFAGWAKTRIAPAAAAAPVPAAPFDVGDWVIVAAAYSSFDGTLGVITRVEPGFFRPFCVTFSTELREIPFSADELRRDRAVQ